MNSRNIFFRKIMYLVAIGVLLGLLYLFGHPSTADTPNEKGSPGGILAQYRNRQSSGLSQTQLGQIDPTSETIKLATFGLRGVAALVLWEKANDYKMKEDWANFAATLNQIIKVEPHFVSVWIHQAWNMSYNVSVEFDDYHERYRWVIKGINYLKKGIDYNKFEPRLLWETGWMISQKIGRADDHKYYRRLFKADDEFNESRPLALRDNWLVGKEWFLDAIKLADSIGKGVGGKSPLIYLSDPPMSQMNYSEAIETEGTYGEVARRAWKTAGDEWFQYGSIPIPSTYGVDVYLNDKEKEDEIAKKLVAQLDALQPGLRDEIREKKHRQLTDEQRAAYDTPLEKRTLEQQQLTYEAEERMRVTHEDVARQIKGAQHAKAKKLAEEATNHEETATYTSRYRETVNFLYWRLRAQVEQTDEALNARKFIYQGDRAYRDGDPTAARNDYDQGFALWRQVLDKFPALIEDEVTGSDLMDLVMQYQRILKQLDEPFPAKFPLQDVVDRYGKKPG
ncbi:MAG: hypothetical protein ABSE63_02690 [Thermoguttaceae bacterium]